MSKKKETFEGGADSVFNFIFSSANKNIRDSKPFKPSGASGNAMADSLGEIALRPAMYAGEQVLTPLNETLNNYTVLESPKINMSHGADLKMKVTGGNFASFMSDPDSFIDKAFSKYEASKKDVRRLNMVRGLGGLMDLGVTASVAKSAGLNSNEAVKLGWQLGNEHMSDEKRNEEAERHAARRSAFVAASANNMSNARKYSYEEVDKLANDLFTVLSSTRLERSGNASNRSNFEAIVSKGLRDLGHTDAALCREVTNRYAQFLDNHGKKYNKGGYGNRYGEFWNLGNDVDVDNQLTSKQEKEKKAREAASLFGDDTSPDKWEESSYASNKYKGVLGRELDAERYFLTREIARFSQSGDTNSAYLSQMKDRLSEVQKKRGLLKMLQRSNGADMKYSKLFGEAYLHGRAFNQMILQGGGLSAILSGEFFDSGNYWSPSTEKKNVVLKGFDEDSVFDGVELKVAKDDRANYYKTFTGLYYLTPGSIARTLFVNGEGFVYLGYLKEQRIKNLIKNSSSLYDLAWAHSVSKGSVTGGDVNPFDPTAGLQGVDNWAEIPDQDKPAAWHLNNMLKDVDINDKDAVLERMSEDYDRTLKILNDFSEQGDIKNHAALQGLLGKLDRLTNKLKNSSSLRYARRLNAIWTKIKRFSPKTIISRFMEKGVIALFGKRLASNLFNGSIILKRAIKSFVTKQIAKLGLHALGQSLGLALGGIANALIYVLTELIYAIAEKLLKPVLKFAVFIVCGVLLLIPVLICGGANKALDAFDRSAAAAPIDIVECEIEEVNDAHWMGHIFGPYPYEEFQDWDEGGEIDWGDIDEDFFVEAGVDWLWPVSNCRNITSGFRTSSRPNHDGIDIACGDVVGSPLCPSNKSLHAPNQRILSAQDGKVEYVCPNPQRSNCGGAGNYIVLKHRVEGRDFYTRYLHLYTLTNVRIGDDVKRGQTLGIMGNTGDCWGRTGVHLHFDISIGDPWSSSARFNPCNLNNGSFCRR